MMKYMLLVTAVMGLLGLGILTPKGEEIVSHERPFVVRVPRDFPTIQQAIDAVVEGGTVLIGPGLYKENLTITKSVRLVGAGQERVQIQGRFEGSDSKIISFFSRSILQIYIQDLTIGDPTFPIEQVLPPTPPIPEPSSVTGLWILFAPMQMVLKRVTIGGLPSGMLGSSRYYDQGVALSSQIVLEEVNVVRNLIGLFLSGPLTVIRSKIEENIAGIIMDGQLTIAQSSVSKNRFFGISLSHPSNPYGVQEFMGYIVENEFKQNGVGISLASRGVGDWIVIGNNRFVQNERYGVVIQDPACPIDSEPPSDKSAPIHTFGGNNEFHNNGQDLCPPDYPWPPGFRK